MMSSEELEKIVSDATRKAIDDKLGQFFIAREQHYQDHQSIQAFRKWAADAKSTFWKTIITAIGWTILGLLLLGFVFWGQHHFK